MHSPRLPREAGAGWREPPAASLAARNAETGEPSPLRLDAGAWRMLLGQLGPSLALWRAAEVALLRTIPMARPILDVGCGDGLVTSLAAAPLDIGLDPDPVGLAKASQRGAYLRVLQGSAEEPGLRAGSIGTVLSNSVFEHIERLDAALAALAGTLRGGGSMVITTPTEAFATWLVLPGAPYASARNRKLIHHHLLSIGEWEDRLQRAGLQIERVQPYLRRRLVFTWDALDQAESVWIARRRLLGLAWKRLPPSALARLAACAAALDLSSGNPGGGRLIIARKSE